MRGARASQLIGTIHDSSHSVTSSARQPTCTSFPCWSPGLTCIWQRASLDHIVYRARGGLVNVLLCHQPDSRTWGKDLAKEGPSQVTQPGLFPAPPLLWLRMTH